MLGFMFGAALFGGLAIKNAYDTCNINDNARNRAIENGSEYYFGRRGEMIDVVTGKRCCIRRNGRGDAWLATSPGNQFIRLISGSEDEREREKARKENRLGYLTRSYICNPVQVKRETSTGRPYHIDQKNPKYICYEKIVDGYLMPDGVRRVPEEAFWYYFCSGLSVPEDIMKKVIEYEEKEGIYREQGKKKEN